jgi:hypothetical protein
VANDDTNRILLAILDEVCAVKARLANEPVGFRPCVCEHGVLGLDGKARCIGAATSCLRSRLAPLQAHSAPDCAGSKLTHVFLTREEAIEELRREGALPVPCPGTTGAACSRTQDETSGASRAAQGDAEAGTQ